MDKPIFEVEISNGSPKGYETATVMKMPATWSEFNDALQKARITDGRFCKNELTCIRYGGLRRGIIGDNVNLYDLNLFAQRLATLTEDQQPGMETLLKIEQEQHSGPIPLERLINLTYNTDICCFAPKVSNHEELGAFLYDSEMLSDEAMALLDVTEENSGFRERLLELLGEQHQEDHGGVFTDCGYAELGGEIKPIYVYRPGEVAYLSSQLPLLRDAKWDADKQYKTASNVKPQQAGEHMSQALGTVAFTLPHSAELEGCYLAGNLLADLSMKDSRVFRKEIEKIAREVFGC